MNSNVDRILVRGVNWLGDAIMTTPALLRLREAHPSAYIALLTPAKLAGLWQDQPVLNEVIRFEESEGLFKIVRTLKSQAFNTALIFPNSPRSALECFLAGIPRRVGFVRAWRTWLLTDRIRRDPEEFRMHKRSPAEVRARIQGKLQRPARNPSMRSHQIFHYLRLAGVLGARVDALEPTIMVPPDRVKAIRSRFGLESGKKRPLLGLNPGAEYGPAKRWPEERFISTAVQLRNRLGCDVWVFGGMADRDLAARITDAIVAHAEVRTGIVQSLAGQTSLPELCAALKACDVVLTNDTGPMHVAAAVGTPVVVPFGSTSPVLTGPGLPGTQRHELLTSSVPCSPCFLRQCPIDFRCMEEIQVDAVVSAVLRKIIAQ